MTQKQTGEGRRERPPSLLAGSHRWVAPCTPQAVLYAVHVVTVEFAQLALALLVAGRGAVLHHFLICWRRAEGQSPGPGLCPAPRPRPGPVTGSARAPTSRHPPAVWVSEEELRVPRQSGLGAEGHLLRYTPNQPVCSFPQEDHNSPTRCGPRTVSPSIAGGFRPSSCEGLGPGAAPTSHVYAAVCTGPTLCPHVNVTPPHCLCSEPNTRGS